MTRHNSQLRDGDPITALQGRISVRAFNVLYSNAKHAEAPKTVGELRKLSDEELLSISWLGPACLSEVRQAIGPMVSDDPIDSAALSENRRCDRCRFWRRFDSDGNLGACQRHAPQLYGLIDRTASKSEGCKGSWPQTFDGSWCGDFEPGL